MKHGQKWKSTTRETSTPSKEFTSNSDLGLRDIAMLIYMEIVVAHNALSVAAINCIAGAFNGLLQEYINDINAKIAEVGHNLQKAKLEQPLKNATKRQRKTKRVSKNVLST